MSPNGTSGLETRDGIRERFLHLTGLSEIEVIEETAGPEPFLRFLVGQDAPLYRHVLTVIDGELPPSSQYKGRLSLKPSKQKYKLDSKETDLLRSLITRSLRVTSEQVSGELIIKFVPFRGREDQTITQPANHVIQGRRGVGKSSLVLLGVRKLLSTGHRPVWVDMQPYRGRSDNRCIIEIIREIVQLAGIGSSPFPHDLSVILEFLDGTLKRRTLSEQDITAALPRIREGIRAFTHSQRSQLYVFLDDAHLVSAELQPLLFDAVYAVLKGAGGWLNVAGVKHLTVFYDSGRRVGLQMPHDAQPIDLDLTLTDPRAARDHLVAILEQFLRNCGIRRRASVIPDAAIERLVWCSAGVPRDFLWLFQTALQHALQNRRGRIGVQEVNLAVGEFSQAKMTELAEDTTQNADSLRELLESLQQKCLDELKSNSFLVKFAPRRRGYELLQKLMDLRLIHLLHPSITPGKAGERYEAYLLDYSFYTGVRRRHGLKELHISSHAPLRYVELRKLPKVDLDSLMAPD
jgi:hypothetical protein